MPQSQLSQSHSYKCFIQGRQRPTGTPQQLLPRAPPFLAMPGQPTSQVTQLWLRNYHLLLTRPNKLIRTQTYENLFQLKHYGVDREADKNLPHCQDKMVIRLSCAGLRELHCTTELHERSGTPQDKMVTQQGDKKLLASPHCTLQEYKAQLHLDMSPTAADRDCNTSNYNKCKSETEVIH